MLSLLFSIFMGALIGYGTNTLAVEMLFRPFEPKYIGKWRLPFTPGLIPKEQKRIAESLGALLEEELFSAEAIRNALQAPESKAAFAAWVEGLFAAAARSEKTPRELLVSALGEAEYIQKRDDLSALLSAYLAQKAADARLGEAFARQLSRRADAKIPFLPNGALEDMYVNTLGKLIDRELSASLPETVGALVRGEIGSFLGTPLSQTMKKSEKNLPALREGALSLLHTAMVGALPGLLSSGEIRRLTVSRINALEPRELNRLLKGLMKKELAAIEWLGALLGGILGLVTYLAGRLL